MSPNKRELLLMLAALSASAVAPAYAQAAVLDLSAARAVGQAYRTANPAENYTTMRRDLPAAGLNADVIARLRQAVSEDFRSGNVFVYGGWRLSRTEGRLFALLAAA